MVKKIKKYLKFVVCCVLILSLIAPSYAALSASDGSAFVTKAEFDSALADFNARLTTFEAGINSKIDSQVTSYLDRNGIWNGKSVNFLNATRIYSGPNSGKYGVAITNLNSGTTQYYNNFDNREIAGNNWISRWIKSYQIKPPVRWRFYNNNNGIKNTNGATSFSSWSYWSVVDTAMIGDPIPISDVLPKSGLLMMNDYFGQCTGSSSMNRWVMLFQVYNNTDLYENKSVQQMPRFVATVPAFSELTYVCEVKQGETLPTTLNDWIARSKASFSILSVEPVDMTSASSVADIADSSAPGIHMPTDPDLWGTWMVSLKQGIEMQNLFVTKGSTLYLVSSFGWVFRFQFASIVWPMQEFNVFCYQENQSPIVSFEGAIY